MTLLRVGSLLVVGALLWFGGNLIAPLIDELPATFGIGVEIMVVTGIAGLTFTLVVGVAALWAVRRIFAARPWLDLIELPVLYVVWVIGALLVFSMRV